MLFLEVGRKQHPTIARGWRSLHMKGKTFCHGRRWVTIYVCLLLVE